MVAAEPPRRRCFARIRRSLRLPSQMNGVGVAFQPTTASSNQVINSLAVFGCCPRKARSQMMRGTDSAIFSQDPLIGCTAVDRSRTDAARRDTETGQDDDGELQSLGAVNGHEPDRVLV